MSEVQMRLAVSAYRARGGETVCRLGRDVKILNSVLENYCWRELEPIDVDLLLITALITFADRTTLRTQSKRWARAFNLTIPVSDVARWEAPEVQSALVDTLQFVTGDDWRLSFLPRDKSKLVDPLTQLRLKMNSAPEEEIHVIPFSGGLDSLAALHSVGGPNRRAFLVTARSGGVSVERARRIARGGASPLHVGYPLWFRGGMREPSYRTRTFLFFVLAALAWRLAAATSVVVPENGQGSVGTSLIPFGNEHPYRNSHPGFTQRLTRFLRALWGTAPTFRHPFAFKTKAEVLAEVFTKREHIAAVETRSCSQQIRRIKGLKPSDSRTQCGTCGNCLLRRVSLTVAQIPESDAQYLWRDLSASTLELSAKPSVKVTHADEEVAFHAVLAFEFLARMNAANLSALPTHVVEDLAQGLGISAEEGTAKLKRLVQTHASEWQSFREHLDEDSWVNAISDVGLSNARA